MKKQVKVVVGDKKILNEDVKDIKTIFDLPKRAKKIDANTYEVKGQKLRFAKNTGEVIKSSLMKPNTAVVKNKGGRPRLDKVAQRMSVRNGVIDLSWEQLQRVLKNPKYDDKIKIMIALRMAEKTIPQQVDITSGGQPLILPAEIMKKNNI